MVEVMPDDEEERDLMMALLSKNGFALFTRNGQEYSCALEAAFT